MPTPEITNALHSCTPAHALMVLVRYHGADYSECLCAYNDRLPRNARYVSLHDAEADEAAFMRNRDI